MFSTTKVKREVHLYIRFQLRNSLGKTKTNKQSINMCFQFGNSFGNTIMKGKASLYVRFQISTSFGNTKMKRKASLYVQLGNSFGNTKVKKEAHKYIISIRLFMW